MRGGNIARRYWDKGYLPLEGKQEGNCTFSVIKRSKSRIYGKNSYLLGLVGKKMLFTVGWK